MSEVGNIARMCQHSKILYKVFLKIFLLYLWVFYCVKVAENGDYSEVKYGSTCNSDKHYNPNTAVTRAANNSLLIEKGFSQISSKTFKNDAVRVWNKCPSNIKDCKMIYSAKKAIKDYVMNLPI